MWMNKEFEMPFIVIQPIDLNAYPELRVIYFKNNFFIQYLRMISLTGSSSFGNI